MIPFEMRVSGFLETRAAIHELGPAMANTVYGPALFSMAKIVAAKARTSGYVYRDRTGRLRKSIRAVRVQAFYYGRRYRRGRAKVFAGGAGARQAFLVHQGHGGPVTARPYRYLVRALDGTTRAQLEVFKGTARRRFNGAVARARARGPIASSGSGGTIRTFGRTVARRGRRG